MSEREIVFGLDVAEGGDQTVLAAETAVLCVKRQAAGDSL